MNNKPSFVALQEAIKKGLTPELEAIIFTDPYVTYQLAIRIPQPDPNKLLDISCKDYNRHWLAVMYAVDVKGVDLKQCEKYACRHPQSAFEFVREVPLADYSKLCKVILRNKLPIQYMIKHAIYKGTLDKLLKEPGWDSEINNYFNKRKKKHDLAVFRWVLSSQSKKLYETVLSSYKENFDLNDIKEEDIINFAKKFVKALKEGYPRTLNEIMIREIIK